MGKVPGSSRRGPGFGGPILTQGSADALSPSPSLLNSLMTAICLWLSSPSQDHHAVTQEAALSLPHWPGVGPQTTFLPCLHLGTHSVLLSPNAHLAPVLFLLRVSWLC